MEGYCMKCKAKKEMQDPQQVTTKNGRMMTKGKCPDCGTTICKIGGTAKQPAVIKTTRQRRSKERRFFIYMLVAAKFSHFDVKRETTCSKKGSIHTIK